MSVYNVKMRAEKERRHISGAERLISKDQIQQAMAALIERAMHHPNGEPDAVSVTVKRVDLPLRIIPALPVSERFTRTPEEARLALAAELRSMGLSPEPILEAFYQLTGMRGAVLLDVRTLCPLEPDGRRGIRATCMDYSGNRGGPKNHLKEALCLASKVVSCPGIIGELCMSDDPGYTTGYFASQGSGYVRLTNIKAKGDPRGGRIFLFDGAAGDVTECIRFLEEMPVLVKLD